MKYLEKFWETFSILKDRKKEEERLEKLEEERLEKLEKEKNEEESRQGN
jgi:membrane protein involved in colicin uptake